DSRQVAHLLTRATFAVGLAQGQLAERLGVSRRSISRWTARETTPGSRVLADLARLVHPKDAVLAERIAAACGETLASLGIAAPPTAPAAPAPVASRPPSRPASLVVDAVVCAAADAASQPPAAVRAMLLAAFERAIALGLSAEDVVTALRGPAR